MTHLSWHLMKRLTEYVDGFSSSFGRKGREDAARRYLKGLLSDAKRKNIQRMWTRITDRGDYQSLQHFITHSTWRSSTVWDSLRQKIPDEAGVLIVDDTGIAKRGTQSVGVMRQYSGTLGKVGMCQVVVSTVLRTKHCTWPLGMDLYMPQEWIDDDRRRKVASVPEDLRFRKKWEIALDQIDESLTSGVQVCCVTADSAYGNSAAFRGGLETRGLRYVVAIKVTDKAFAEPPNFVVPKQKNQHLGGRPRTKGFVAGRDPKPETVRVISNRIPDEQWETVAWRKGSKGTLKGEFLAIRVTPSQEWHKGKQHESCWLLCGRAIGAKKATQFHFSNLPADTSLKRLVQLARTRWPIEQSYEQLKDELALDHFEGRSHPGFHHHLVLTAMAYTFLQLERQRSRAKKPPTLNALRMSLTELVTAQLFASDEKFSRLVTEFVRNPPDF